jgi:hypothetical protein
MSKMNDEQTQEQQQKLLSNEMMEIYEKYVTPHTGDFELLSRSTPLMETGLFIGMIGLAYNPEIIVYCFKFIMLLNVLISGVTLASFIVGTFIYSKEDVEDTDGYESEVDEKYEDMYDIDEIEDISGNPSENVYISDVTPDGIAFMKYNKYKEGFEYWAEKSIQYDYLETMCRKYVKNCRCKNMYIDRKRLLREKRSRLEQEKKRQEEQSEMEKEDLVKLDDVDDDDDVFAKLKTNVDKRYDETTRKKNKQDSVVDQANKYIYMGKINEMLAFKTTRNDELSDTATKKNVSFSMFKALGLK